jgi:hypothetical protein
MKHLIAFTGLVVIGAAFWVCELYCMSRAVFAEQGECDDE